MLRDVLGRRISNDDEKLFMNTPGGITEEIHHERVDHHHQNGLNDDIFGSAPSSPVLTGHDAVDEESTRRHVASADHSDIPRLRSTHVTNGYREGIAASKEKYIQEGFDEGWSLGGEIGLKAGWCLGALEGICRGLSKVVPKTLDTGENAVSYEEARKLLEQAQDELMVEKLFGQDYFRPDGISLFGVPVQDGEEEQEVTFSDLAAAHPILRKWVVLCSTFRTGSG